MYHKAWRRSLSWWRLMFEFISKIGICFFVLAFVLSVSAKETLEPQAASSSQNRSTSKSYAGYNHLWPDIRFSWKIVLGTVIAFLGAAFGSVGGVGGGGFFVPMLTLIIGFDQKSSVAVSKCIITSGAAATVLYNVRLRHPSLELPLIDYDLALLFQPMLVLGISIGVSLNVLLPEWIITIILIIVLLGTATRSFLKGIETWKKETKTKKTELNASRSQESNGVTVTDVEEGNTSSTATNDPPETKQAKRRQVPILENVYWKQLGTITTVWCMILGLQIGKNYVKKCSVAYWSLDLLQIPVTVAVSSYKMLQLSKGNSTLSSRGSETATNWKMYKLVAYGVFCIIAGLIGGLLGLGGGFIMGPLFLEMGIPPQVSSATATFIMLFSSSISVVEYYLLKRFPIPYALYFAGVATVSAIIGQHVVGKVIKALGRASIIIFILAFTVYMNSFLLGGIGIANMVKKFMHKEYMGFENMCTHKS